MAQADDGVPTPGDLREVAIEAAQAAGEILRAGYGQVQEVRLKGEVDVVTEVDERSEAAIVEIIGRRFPSHRVLAEEGSEAGSDVRFRWIIDPLDGTTNYAHGLPFFCTSIAFESDGQVTLGLVYDPLRDEMFMAQRGRGANLNGRRLSVTSTDVLLHALVATGFPYDRSKLPRAMGYFELLSQRSRAVRRLGSAALDACYVAAGRLDCYWEAIVMPWDIAAGWLMVEEAGGRVTDLMGEPFSFEKGQVLASNGAINQTMIATLAEADGRN